MRKVTYSAAVSLDGFIAGPGETIDWLKWSDDAAAIVRESWRGVDTMLLGRKTYEFAQKVGGGPVPKGVTTYVFSRTLERVAEGNELVTGDAAEFVRGLKRGQGGTILVMGGGELGSTLLGAGLVDEVGVRIHPILLGGGVPMFPPSGWRSELDLVESRAIAHGCLFARYKVKPD